MIRVRRSGKWEYRVRSAVTFVRSAASILGLWRRMIGL
jgi:hypothetical protein